MWSRRVFTALYFFIWLVLSAGACFAQIQTDLWRQISFSTPIIEKGIKLIDAPSGRWQAAQRAGQSCIEMRFNHVNDYACLYFSVEDSYIYNDGRDVFVAIDYLDQGAGKFYMQYDDGLNPFADGGSKVLTGTNQWLKQIFILSNVGFTNHQDGGADFRIVVLDTAQTPLAVKRVAVWRAPGDYIAPRYTNFSGDSFLSDDDLLFSYYFYWYDVYSGLHIWDNGAHTDDALQDHPTSMVDFSYLSVAWHKRELLNIMAAGIDVILPIYWGSSREMAIWSVVGLQKLVQAEQELIAEGKKPPKIGLFFDTSTLYYGEEILKSEDGATDLSTFFGMVFFYKHLRDFYSLIPPTLWARIDNQPVVWLYAAGFAKNPNQTLVPFVNERFAGSFAGLRPYIVRETSWNIRTAKEYAWGAALNGAQLLSVASVGPGYNDLAVPGRTTPVRQREDGAFYRRNWNTVLSSGCNFVVVETWNELHEGTDICDSREYGRQYINLTAEFSQALKQSTKWFSFQPQGGMTIQQPTCQVQVQDKKYGLLPSTVRCRYTDDNGVTWHAWPVTCTGSEGATEALTVLAANVPFIGSAKPLSTPNHLQIIIEKTNGDSAVSPTFAVVCGIASAFTAQIDWSSASAGVGLQQRCQRNDDGWCSETTVAAVLCVYNLVKNVSPYPGRYLYFDVTDSLMFAGSSQEMWLTIEYYDTLATGTVVLQYDSPGAALANWYKSGGTLSNANSRKWKNKTFHLSDAWFANRENGGSDFRFYTSGVLFLSKVTVSNREATAVLRESRNGSADLPKQFNLGKNYPNPFNQSTTIYYSLKKSGAVALELFDVSGKHVCTLVKEQQPASDYQYRWEGTSESGSAASGLYFLRMTVDGEVCVRRLLLLR